MNKEKIGIKNYLMPYWLVIVIYVLAMILAGAVSIFMTIILADAIEFITLGNFNEAVKLMFFSVGLAIVRRSGWLLASYLYNIYSVKIMANLNADLARQAFKLNSRTYTSHDTGTFVQRIVTDPERVVDSLASIGDMLTEIITAFAMIVYISTLNVYVSIVILSLIFVSLIIEFIRVKVRRKTKKAVRTANDKITSLTTEIVRSERDIKSLALEDELSVVSDESYGKFKKALLKHNNIDTAFWSARNFLIEIVNLLTLVLAIAIMDKGLITLATFMVIYSNRNSIYDIVWSIGNISNRFVDIKVSTDRMFSLFDEDEFVTDKFGDVSLETIAGDIEFKNVSFTYYEYEYEENKKDKKLKGKKKKQRTKKLVSENKIFDNLNFQIPRNTTVAFVGKSGSGKSTILNLIAKMNEVESGEVLIDGINVNKLDKETLRNTFSLVNQFPYIFDMTIKENLKLAKPEATDDEIIEAIRLASLDEFVNGLPPGIDTKVGESGIKLSGGQKQRLAIARAMLRRSSIILFDESTSSLDNFAQEEVKKSIDGLKGTSTIVIVAHRLSTIKDSDIIFFLDEGKIIDQGNFDHLYKNNEKFQRMFLAENIEKFNS